MSSPLPFLLLVICTMAVSACSQPRFYIQLPTAEEEANAIWRTLQDIEMLEGFGYEISLPNGAIIDSLATKSKAQTLTDADYLSLLTFVQEEVYQKEDYLAGAQKVKSNLFQLDSFLGELEALELPWKFRTFQQYAIRLTLYGTGGSYNPDEGSILVFTTPSGDFKQYDEPLNTLIHEIVHIGIEDAIIQQFQVPHAMKERIVDTIVKRMFGDRLPEYRIQEMGDNRVDSYLIHKDDISKLYQVVRNVMMKN